MPRIKSIAAKVANGTYKRHRDPSIASRGEPLIPVPPPDDLLTKPEQAVWTRLGRDLEGIVTAGDLEFLRVTSVMGAAYWALARDRKATINQKVRAGAAYQAMLAAFGMVPNARERVPVLTAKATESPFDDM